MVKNIRSKVSEIAIYLLILTFLTAFAIGVSITARSAQNSANSGAIHLDATPTNRYTLEAQPESILINWPDRTEIILYGTSRAG